MTPERFKQLREEFSKTGPVAECLDEIERLRRDLDLTQTSRFAFMDLSEALEKERDQLRATNARLASGLRIYQELIDSGWLGRETSRDHEPDWALKQIEPVMKLKRAHESLTPDALDDLRVIREAMSVMSKGDRCGGPESGCPTQIVLTALKERFG